MEISIENNKVLTDLNTFHLPVYCDHFCEISSVGEFRELITKDIYRSNKKLVLGGGSNILFRDNFKGIVIRNNFKGIELKKEDDEFVYVKAGAGENWHLFVQHCINNGWAGIENLSLIPGQVGASPMQNIGAYGVEIKDVFEDLEALDMNDGSLRIFKKAECKFAYRESVFKREHKNRYLIISVTYKLKKNSELNTSYGAIEEELKNAGISNPTIKDVSEAVIRIRKSKLPDPAQIGNAGSFFKNPEIGSEQFNELKAEFPNIVSYPLPNGNFKLAAGWLIEQSGLKGLRKGDAGVHTKQALVLVNYGNASGNDIFQLSQEVLDAVKAKFGVDLEREVNIVP